jgi:hypothetical protein
MGCCSAPRFDHNEKNTMIMARRMAAVSDKKIEAV